MNSVFVVAVPIGVGLVEIAGVYDSYDKAEKESKRFNMAIIRQCVVQ